MHKFSFVLELGDMGLTLEQQINLANNCVSLITTALMRLEGVIDCKGIVEESYGNLKIQWDVTFSQRYLNSLKQNDLDFCEDAFDVETFAEKGNTHA